MCAWGKHQIVELLRKHCRGKKCDRSQGFLPNVGKVVAHIGRDNKHASGTESVDTRFHAQLALSGEDVLGLHGGIRMPSQSPPGLDLVDDRRGLRCPTPTAGSKRSGPTYGGIILPADRETFQAVACDDRFDKTRPLSLRGRIVAPKGG